MTLETSPRRSRTFVYARKSLTRDGSESLDLQVEQCQQAAERLALQVVDVLIEKPSTSGFKNRGRSRPKFQELLERIAGGEAHAVTVYKSDRLSRGGGPGWAPLIDAFEAAGVDLDRAVCTPGGWMSEFEIGIRGTMDREESKKTRQRMADVRSREAEAGKPRPGGNRPFGFEPDCTTVIAAEAGSINDAARRVLAGEAMWKIAKEWNTEQVMTVTGKPWTVTVLKRILTSPRTAGLREHRGEVVGNGRWPAILDTDTWEAVRANIAARTHASGSNARTFPLVGTVRCGICDRPLRSSYSKDRYRAYRVYACRPGPGLGGCGGIKIAAAPVEDLVKRYVLGKLADPENRERLLRFSQPDDDGSAAERIEKLRARRGRFIEMVGDGLISKEEFRQLSVAIEVELNEIFGALTSRRGAIAPDLPSTIDGLADAWDAGGITTQRSLIALTLQSLVVRPATRRGPGLDPGRLDWNRLPTLA